MFTLTQLKRKDPADYLPHVAVPQDIAHVALVVAAEGGIDWAAYVLTNCKNDHRWQSDHSLDEFIEFAAEKGTKLTEKMARKLFPDMRDKAYRT